ncbi:unnamed protein product [Fusarium graminearum]|uniref:Chromosome 1, complete genome n=1 Tax=Gibberella zeae (strain ATCC MYA-4620 / CBS 123657 / FGSC 9075 / NRRL 31084 / PH-1) TaxID=229533 RepID=I1SA23_GIBZE|nr:hypothetical protein FGSG_13704 [Fusarium graminearum PH-1]ESU16781.1 hypothetical protein FGSG_13704 [Fusarium graminearum PH-1]CEF75455.1 unnamed protein product [Fusarium graminearum]CZS78734.1 unnamed protein product [Fusarium graminearum]|eukprot:XP_011319043.1 hypothetical protein FGSG_13704 [Fusarium graminearum PH-1]
MEEKPKCLGMTTTTSGCVVVGLVACGEKAENWAVHVGNTMSISKHSRPDKN